MLFDLVYYVVPLILWREHFPLLFLGENLGDFWKEGIVYLLVLSHWRPHICITKNKQTNGHLFENSHSALITSILKGSEMVLCFQRGLGLLVVYSLIRLILISNNKVGLKSFRIWRVKPFILLPRLFPSFYFSFLWGYYL